MKTFLLLLVTLSASAQAPQPYGECSNDLGCSLAKQEKARQAERARDLDLKEEQIELQKEQLGETQKQNELLEAREKTEEN